MCCVVYFKTLLTLQYLLVRISYKKFILFCLNKFLYRFWFPSFFFQYRITEYHSLVTFNSCNYSKLEGIFYNKINWIINFYHLLTVINYLPKFTINRYIGTCVIHLIQNNPILFSSTSFSAVVLGVSAHILCGVFQNIFKFLISCFK